MSVREIIKVPNPFLKVVAKPVININQNILSLLDDMLETMYHANGIGLAATQIAIDKRLIVMDCGKNNLKSEEMSEEEFSESNKKETIEPYPIKMINPEIIYHIRYCLLIKNNPLMPTIAANNRLKWWLYAQRDAPRIKRPVFLIRFLSGFLINCDQ